MKTRYKLLGSDSDLERLRLRVENYFYVPIEFHPDGENKYTVRNTNNVVHGFRVIRKNNRYRFEVELHE